MNKELSLGQIARFNGILVLSTGVQYTVEYSSDGEEVLLYNGRGITEAHYSPDDLLYLHTEATHHNDPVFRTADLDLLKDADIKIVKQLDIAEYLMTGEHPKVPYAKVKRKLDRVIYSSAAVNVPKAGVYTHALLGKFLLHSEFSSPIFKENNDVVIGREISRKQAEAKAEEILWQQEGFLMATLLGNTE